MSLQGVFDVLFFYVWIEHKRHCQAAKARGKIGRFVSSTFPLYVLRAVSVTFARMLPSSFLFFFHACACPFVKPTTPSLCDIFHSVLNHVFATLAQHPQFISSAAAGATRLALIFFSSSCCFPQSKPIAWIYLTFLRKEPKRHYSSGDGQCTRTTHQTCPRCFCNRLDSLLVLCYRAQCSSSSLSQASLLSVGG